MAGLDVAFQVKDLLPGAEHDLPALDRNGEGRAKQRSLQVRVAVAVVPCLLVAVVRTRWHQLVQNRGQVPLEAGLEFDRADGTSAADVENMRHAGAHA